MRVLISIFFSCIFFSLLPAQNDSLYKATLFRADNAFDFKWSAGDRVEDTGRFKAALVLYKQASALRPQENYPVQRIRQIAQILENLRFDEAKRKMHGEYLLHAEAMYNIDNYKEAIRWYRLADSLKPDHENKEWIALCQDLGSLDNRAAFIKYIDSLQTTKEMYPGRYRLNSPPWLSEKELKKGLEQFDSAYFKLLLQEATLSEDDRMQSRRRAGPGQ